LEILGRLTDISVAVALKKNYTKKRRKNIDILRVLLFDHRRQKIEMMAIDGHA